MLWVLQCQKAAPKMPCEHSKFMDNIDLVSLARFIKAFNLDLVVRHAVITSSTGVGREGRRGRL